MSIKKKFLIIFCFVVISFLVTGGIISKIVLDGFLKAEKQEVSESAVRVQDALSNNITELSTKLSDWSAWDDSYKFIQDKNPTYIKSNLNTDSLSALKITTMLFFDENQNIVYEKNINLKALKDIPLPDDLLGYLKDSNLLHFSNTGSSRQGVIRLKSGIFLMSLRPIITSQFTGPIQGTLVFGRYLDLSLIKNLSDLTHLKINFYPYDSVSLPEDVSSVKSSLDGGSNIITKVLGTEIAGYRNISDIQGSTAVIERVVLPRDIYKEGIHSIFLFLITFLLASILTGGIVAFLIQKLILSKLWKLVNEVDILSKSEILGGRLKIQGKDEIGRLAEEINKMIESVEKVESKTIQGEKRFGKIIENISEFIVTVDNTNKISYVSPSITTMLGYSLYEFMQTDFFSHISISDLGEMNQIFSTVVSNPGQLSQFTTKIKHKDGSWRTIEGTVVNLLQMQGVESVVYNFSDVTKKHELEEEISKRSKELEEKVAELEKLNRFMIDREIRMKELKDENEKLKSEKN